MGESVKHRELVHIILDKIVELVPSDARDLIKADYDGYELPSLSYGEFIPDVFYCYQNLLIIGEAKTYDDLAREHSILQFDSYFVEFSKFAGNTCLIVSVPWECFITAKNMFRNKKMKYKLNTKIYVLTDNGFIGEI